MKLPKILNAVVAGLCLLLILPRGMPVWASGVMSSAYNLIENAGTPLTRETTINCVAPVTCSDFKGTTAITASGVGTTSTIANGTATLNPGAISSATCSAAIDGGTATGVATTDSIITAVAADPTATTGYIPSASGSLYIWTYPTANHVNFLVCNNTSGAITPGSITMNWRVVR